jgi:16S rRNA (guanine1207-N2)-methyltransferase
VTTTGPADPFFKKTITMRMQGHALELDVAHDLFSGHDIDTGSRLLLRSIAASEHEDRARVIDLGCGYGPLGLGLRLLAPRRSVEMVDRDALAITYSKRNAERNGMSDVDVYASLGWSDVRADDYDLGVCNVPAKAGEGAIRHFLLDARAYLAPSALMAIVVIARLDELVRSFLTSKGVRISYEKRTAGYSVYHYGFLPEDQLPGSALDPVEVFIRGKLKMVVRGVEYELRTAYSLPEFDTLGYHTELVAERLLALRGRPRHVLVFNPGQGHLPVLAWKHLQPERLTLVGRDLLALRLSRANAVANGCAAEAVHILHQVAVRAEDVVGVDLALALLEDGQPRAISEVQLGALASGPQPPRRLLLGGTSTDITRLEAALTAHRVLRVAVRKRRKGHSVLELAA